MDTVLRDLRILLSDESIVLRNQCILLCYILIVLIDLRICLSDSVVIRDVHGCPCHIGNQVRSQTCSVRRSAYYVVCSVRTIPYIIIAVICNAVIDMPDDMRRQDSYPMSVAVVVSAPVICRPVPAHEVSVARMYPRPMVVVRADMYRWLLRTVTMSHLRFCLRRSV